MEKDKLVRMSISLPEKILTEFDSMVAERQYDSRSQAITDMLHQHITDYKTDTGDAVMAGTINIVYDHSIPNVQKKLAELQYKYVDEVISALNVNLEHAKTLSVILVQGPNQRLKKIANDMIASRGVITGKMVLSTAILPPVHPLPTHSLTTLHSH